MSEPRTILLVEDSAEDARRIAEGLAGTELRTCTVRNVDRLSAALAALAIERVDVVLLDLNLPDSRGLGTFTELRARARGAPILVLTGVDDDVVAARAMQEGAQDYLVKDSLDGRSLQRAIRYAVERRRFQEAMWKREEHFRSLIENALDVITVIRPDGTIAYASPSVEPVLGYRADALVGAPIWGFVHPDDVPRVQGILGRTAERVSVEFRFQHGDGAWLVLEAVAKTVLEDDGEPVAVVNARDITARREAEERLRKLSRAVEQSPVSIVITDTAGTIEYVNPKFCQVSGYAAEELIGQNPRLMKSGHTPAAEYERLWETITAGGTWRGELHNRKKSGELYCEVAAISPIVNGGGKISHFLGIKEDVTERRRAEEEMRRQREVLFQSEKLAAMGQLLAGVAHELNNPLAVVLGRATLLESVADGGPLAAQAQKIVKAADRCARIVKNFLALARQRPPSRQAVQLNKIVEEAVELLAYALRVDSVEVTLDLAPGLPAMLADPHQLHQVVMNLVANAHQAIREATPVKARQIRLTTRHDPATGRVLLEAADSGPGIPPDVRARIFEPFYTTKPPGQGTGLGLAICQGIVESHGGTISLTSPPGAGAVFQVALPVAATPVVAAREAAPAPLTGRAILVLDDEPEVTAVLAELLSIDAHVVSTAHAGEEALERLRTAPFDLILSDVKMPGMDGPAFYREAQTLDPELPRRFVFLTGDTLSRDTRQFLEESGVPSLGKPFTLGEVRRVLRETMQSAAVPA